MTTNLAKWASNNDQNINSWLSGRRRVNFLPSMIGFAYDMLSDTNAIREISVDYLAWYFDRNFNKGGGGRQEDYAADELISR